MTAKTDKMVVLARAVRGAFNRLKALGDELHGDLHITTAMRAVMETLSEDGPMTVPQIAKSKGVTRQHIQMLGDALCEAGLTTVKDNPAHRRSSLLVLTEKGKRGFATMRAREASVVNEIAAEFETRELDNAALVLSRLIARIDARLRTDVADA